MYERLSRLVRAVEEANDDFDHLAFTEERFPVGGDCIGTMLAANLDYLRDELRALAMEHYAVAS